MAITDNFTLLAKVVLFYSSIISDGDKHIPFSFQKNFCVSSFTFM